MVPGTREDVACRPDSERHCHAALTFAAAIRRAGGFVRCFRLRPALLLSRGEALAQRGGIGMERQQRLDGRSRRFASPAPVTPGVSK